MIKVTLIDFLKEKKARLLFGKSELEIIRKQLLGLELKPSEKTRLSRDIRKKFEVIEELSRYKNEFKIKKSQEIEYLITEAVEIIKSELKEKVVAIILFGSYAIKLPTEYSDIDIAIKFGKDFDSATKIRAKLLGKMHSEKIDIQIYENLPKKIQKEIEKKGRILFLNEQNK